jgi:hypothetical protein
MENGRGMELDLTDTARRRHLDAALQYRQVGLAKDGAKPVLTTRVPAHPPSGRDPEPARWNRAMLRQLQRTADPESTTRLGSKWFFRSNRCRATNCCRSVAHAGYTSPSWHQPTRQHSARHHPTRSISNRDRRSCQLKALR